MRTFLISKDRAVIGVRIHKGGEENKEALRKFRGEEDDDFKILEHQAQRGDAWSMFKIGLFYYFGVKSLRPDRKKAISWFWKAAEKGEPRSMEVLGEIYAKGAGVERNYTKALELFTLSSKHQRSSGNIGMGYLYLKGYGVERKNYTEV